MNPTTALKPLAFALAAVMAFAAQADPVQGNGQGSNQPSNGPSLDQILQITSGAGAAVLDSQESSDSGVVNRGTQNDAKIDNSLNSSNGNMGANVAAGNGNQQDLAIAVSGGRVAVAAAAANQSTSGLKVTNNARPEFVPVGVLGLSGITTQQVVTPEGWRPPVTNNASITGSMNNFSGNGGANVSSGVGNQQSNSLSIAAGCKSCP